MLGKNTILKAIHNEAGIGVTFVSVWMLGKNTILKAIHNFATTVTGVVEGVNAG